MKNKTKAAKAVKARKMFCCAADFREHKGTARLPFECTESTTAYGHTMPCSILPRDTSTCARMVTQGARAMYNAGPVRDCELFSRDWRKEPMSVRAHYYGQARAMLKSIGLT